MDQNNREPWELKSIKGFAAGRSDAVLSSKLLDRRLHPSRRVSVSVAGAREKRPPGYLLDEFSRRSIQEYVHSQEKVRMALEKGLAADRKECGAKGQMRGEEAWHEAQIEMVAFDEKNVPTSEGLANMKRLMPKINLERLREATDKPTTKTRFTILLSVAWDGEHARLATFRDGELVSMELH